MSGELLAVSDADFYLAMQSGKGSPANVYRTAMRFTEVQATPTIDGLTGEPPVGSGIYAGPDIGLSYLVEWSARGRVTMGTLPCFLFEWFCDRHTIDVGSGSGPYLHTFAPLIRNVYLPWLSFATIYGEGDVRGSGMAARFVRDSRLSALEFVISSTDALRFNINGSALNMGPGNGSEGFAADDNDIEPSPTNPGVNTFAWPSWVANPNNLCINSITLKWVPQYQLSPFCLSSGEHSGMIVTSARWEMTISLRLDGDSMLLADYIHYKTDAASARSFGYGFKALRPSYKLGEFQFSLHSIENIGSVSPFNVPFQFAGTFQFQWVSATIHSEQSPNTLEIKAHTYNSAWSIAVLNNISGTYMGL